MTFQYVLTISTIFLGLLLGITNNSHACSVCFVGAPEDPAVKALSMAILLLLCLLALIMGIFIKSIMGFCRRAKNEI